MHETINLKEALKRLKAIKTPFAKEIAGWLKDERYEDSEVRWYEGPVDTDELFTVPDVVIVNGDLKTSKSLLDCIDVDESFLAVLGNVEVDNLVSQGTIIIEKNLIAEKLVYGDSLCDLFLNVKGEIYAPVVIETGHSIEADDIHAHIVIRSHNIVVRKNEDCEITDLEWDHPLLHKLFHKDAFHEEGNLDRALVSQIVEQTGDVLLYTDKQAIEEIAASEIGICEKGITLFKEEKYDKALEYFKKVLQEKKDEPEAWLYLGKIFEFYKDEHEKALEYYNKALETALSSSDKKINTLIFKEDIYRSLFKLLIKIGKTDEVYPFIDTWIQSGNLRQRSFEEDIIPFYKEQQDHDNVLNSYDLLIATEEDEEYNYNQGSFIFNKALYAHQNGFMDVALAGYEDQIEHSGKDDYYRPYSCLNKAIILYSKGEYQQTIEFLDSVPEYENLNKDLLFAKGFAFYMLNDLEPALKLFDKALGFDANYSLALFYKASSLLYQKKYSEAYPVMEKALLANPDHLESFRQNFSHIKDEKIQRLLGGGDANYSTKFERAADLLKQRSIILSEADGYGKWCDKLRPVEAEYDKLISQLAEEAGDNDDLLISKLNKNESEYAITAASHILHTVNTQGFLNKLDRSVLGDAIRALHLCTDEQIKAVCKQYLHSKSGNMLVKRLGEIIASRALSGFDEELLPFLYDNEGYVHDGVLAALVIGGTEKTGAFLIEEMNRHVQEEKYNKAEDLARALYYQSPEEGRKILRLLIENELSVHEDICSYYADYGKPEDLDFICERLEQTEDPCWKTELIRALGFCGSIKAVPVLLKQIASEEEDYWRAANEALEILTGVAADDVDLEYTPEERTPWWTRWWNKNKDRFDPSVRLAGGKPINFRNWYNSFTDPWPERRSRQQEPLMIYTGKKLPFDDNAPLVIQEKHIEAWDKWLTENEHNYPEGQWWLKD